MSAGPVLASGTRAGDFRIERRLRRIPGAFVYEATQVSLERRVSLAIMDPPATDDEQFVERFGRESRLLAGLEHPRIASVIAAGRVEQGFFIATRFVAGPLLSDHHVDDRGLALELLGQMAGALDAVHCAGLVHRAIEPGRFVVCNGQAYLIDFALGQRGGTIADDRLAFATVLRALLSSSPRGDVVGRSATSLVAEAASAPARPASPGRPEVSRRIEDCGDHRRRRRALAAGAAAVAVAVAGVGTVALVTGGEPERAAGVQPSLPSGGRALGSDLAAGSERAVDCTGKAPSSSSPSCTVMQARLPGRQVVAERDGVVVGWTVRGARGNLALQVVRPGPRGYTDIARSPFEHVPDDGIHRFGASLPIRRGDRLAVELRPGSGIGVRDGPAGSSTERWIARLTGGPRPPSRLLAGRFDHELLLAAAYLPGGRRRTPAQLTGGRAERAPAGRRLASVAQELPGGEVREVWAVRTEGRIVLDLRDGGRRLSRLEVPDADPGGGLLALVKEDRLAPNDAEQILRWENPGASEPLVHTYRVQRARLELID